MIFMFLRDFNNSGGGSKFKLFFLLCCFYFNFITLKDLCSGRQRHDYKSWQCPRRCVLNTFVQTRSTFEEVCEHNSVRGVTQLFRV